MRSLSPLILVMVDIILYTGGADLLWCALFEENQPQPLISNTSIVRGGYCQAELKMSSPDIPEGLEELFQQTWFDHFLHYGLFLGAIFQLICIAAIIVIPPKSDEEEEDSPSGGEGEGDGGGGTDGKKRQDVAQVVKGSGPGASSSQGGGGGKNKAGTGKRARKRK